MKKTLVTLAAFAATGVFAQSSVTIYGAVDASYNYAHADLATGGQSKTFMGNSNLGSSVLGFMGSEDLGGGLRAIFKLESGLANDSGTGKGTNTNNQASGVASAVAGAQGIVFQRRSYVGLSGDFGELQVGRQYVNMFAGVQAAVDPFATLGPADSTQMALMLGSWKTKSYTAVSASNMIGYATPTLAGFSANLQYFMGENTSGAANSDDGTGYSATGQYTKGPVFVSVGQQQTKYVAGDYLLRGLSASYNFGLAKIAYTYTHEELNVGAKPKNDANLIGVTVPFGAANFKASYIHATNTLSGADQGGDLYGIGIDYALSKRTLAYAAYGTIKNSDGGNSYSTGAVGTLAVNGTSSNLAIGLYHRF
jgi:predicted porin